MEVSEPIGIGSDRASRLADFRSPAVTGKFFVE